MADAEPTLDVSELQRDIHGHRVVSARLCDYCGGTVGIDEPVLYEVIRIVDLRAVERLFGPLEGWVPDAARCQACHRETLSPATEGIDEALVRLELTESAGMLRLDATTLEVVDYAPSGEGYHPPKLNPRLMAAYEDLGLARWIRLQQLQELIEAADATETTISRLIDLSREIPPDLQ